MHESVFYILLRKDTTFTGAISIVLLVILVTTRCLVMPAFIDL